MQKHEELDFDESTKPIKKEIEKSEEKEQLRIDKPIGRPLKDGFIKINGKSFQKQNLWFVIDGANVALTQKTSHLQGKLSKLELIKERLINMDILNYKIICDCSLKHKIDEPAIYSKLVNSGDIIETPAGTQADNFILQYAKNKGAFIISNDRFKEYYNNFGKDWIKEKRIMFTFIEDTVYFDKIFGL